MPVYNPHAIEPKWQKYWEQNQTFRTPELPTGPKLYVLDMFPYPSGAGLHVGHPEGYTATDILCRFERMRGKCVLHPMGFDAFGLPAEEHAIKTGQHPRINTENNIATFRRQLKMLGFSYDWSRELATTDVDYFRWTQWIFLVLFDTWFDASAQRGRPISELPIPSDVRAQGDRAVRLYQDEHRLAYQSDALVNWCPALGTVLANEEVIDGKSERGGHPVTRIPLRQWMLRITAYADRLERDLDGVDWPEGIKKLQRDWIGRSTGAEVDFFVATAGASFDQWKSSRAKTGFPRKPGDDVLRIYTTRPDTLFGATYMVVAPEHPFVERLTTDAQRPAVRAYCDAAASKSDRERQDVAKTKTGVFTGSYAVNPVNGEPIPIWVADYVLWGYGTGAIMAVPAHDERDFEFANKFRLRIRAVVMPPDEWLRASLTQYMITESKRELKFSQELHDFTPAMKVEYREVFDRLAHEEAQSMGTLGLQMLRDEYVSDVADWSPAFTGDGCGLQSSNPEVSLDGLPTPLAKQTITRWLSDVGLGREAVNYKLRDWLFSRQRFWGEPFPILHELDDAGQPTGVIRAVDAADLPVDLPHLDDFKPHGKPEPPLEKATDWVNLTDAAGQSPRRVLSTQYSELSTQYSVLPTVRYRRETNTMPQWAGSCWYYLRFIDPKNSTAFVDPAKERAWMPIDLYVGGAEHAVLHLLYSRFWHKVLFDRGHVSGPEPFRRLVNQGLILGEMEYQISADAMAVWRDRLAEHGVVVQAVESEDGPEYIVKVRGQSGEHANLSEEQVEKRKGRAFLKGTDLELVGKAEKMSKSRGNVVNPDHVVRQYGADSLRLYEMFMGPLEAVKPWSMQGVEGVSRFLNRAWRMIIDEDAETIRLHASVSDAAPSDEQLRVLHKTIQVVTEDIENLRFNTALARLMEFVNFFTGQLTRPRACLEPFVLLLSPLAPHIAEELWAALGHDRTLAYEPWPAFDPRFTREDSKELPVQINGKVRSRIVVAADATPDQIEAAARGDAKIQDLLEGKTIKKVIVVPGKLVNIVVG
jgi:leucyl-tRNA synthetase